MNNIFDLSDLVNNPTPRVPIALLIDTSGSMIRVVRDEGQKKTFNLKVDGSTYCYTTNGIPAIIDVNTGVNDFLDAIRTDEVAVNSAEICVITFGERAKLVSDFETVDRRGMLQFRPYGMTYLGEAVNLALDRLEARKQEYKDKGVDYFQPWLVIITDGEANGSAVQMEMAISRVGELVNNRKLTVLALGVGPEADMKTLKALSPKREPVKINEAKYKEFFEWLSKSVVATAESMPGEIQTLDMDGIQGWGEL